MINGGFATTTRPSVAPAAGPDPNGIVITGNSKEWLEQQVKPAVVEFLAERGLVLSPEKTKVTHIAPSDGGAIGAS